MKIETIVKTMIIVLGVVVVMVGIAQSMNFFYNQENLDSGVTNAINVYRVNLTNDVQSFKTNTMNQSSNPSQVTADTSSSDLWPEYAGKALSAVLGAFGTIGSGLVALNEIWKYMQLDPSVLLFIGMFLTVSIGFALVYFWTGRKP